MNFKFDLQMFGTPNPNDLLVGAGKTYFRRWNDDGTKEPFRHMGNIPDFKMSPNIEKMTKFSSMDAAKEVYAEAVKSMSYKPTLTLDEFNPFNLALALYGQEGVEIQAKKTVTGEVYDAVLGGVIKVPYKEISNVVIEPTVPVPVIIGPATSYIQNGTAGTGSITTSGTYTGADTSAYYIEITKANSTAGVITDAEFTWKKGLTGTPSVAGAVTGNVQTIAEGVKVKFVAGGSGQDFVVGEIYEIKVTAAGSAYIAGKDFIVDKTQLRGGVIPIPTTSGITDSSKVKVSYEVPEKKYPKIMGGTVRKIEGELLFIGDPKHGRPYTLEIWHVAISPTGDVGLISEDWGNFNLELTVFADRVNHPEEPFFKMVDVS